MPHDPTEGLLARVAARQALAELRREEEMAAEIQLANDLLAQELALMTDALDRFAKVTHQRVDDLPRSYAAALLSIGEAVQVLGLAESVALIAYLPPSVHYDRIDYKLVAAALLLAAVGDAPSLVALLARVQPSGRDVTARFHRMAAFMLFTLPSHLREMVRNQYAWRHAHGLSEPEEPAAPHEEPDPATPADLSEAAPPVEIRPDGPFDPLGFSWRGCEKDTTSVPAWRLILAMWGKGWQQSLSVEIEVWGHRVKRVSDTTKHTTCLTANKLLMEAGYPRRVTYRADPNPGFDWRPPKLNGR